MASDTDAVHDAWASHHYVKSAAEASCLAITEGGDQINSGTTFESSLLEGVKQGHCTMADVDQAVKMAMMMRMELGLFDPVASQPMLNYTKEDIQTPAAKALNLLATQRSLVLIKNGVAASEGVEASPVSSMPHVQPLSLSLSRARSLSPLSLFLSLSLSLSPHMHALARTHTHAHARSRTCAGSIPRIS